ncbi:MAG: ATP-binding protein [Imperialibacter sp.]|uniref:AAA family ATPase n=1 Tax=Imperialibacter sp. TaxID=2038411 RepID=UPI0032EB79AA
MMVIIAGLPGSGKTYLATRLAARLGAVHISSDRVRKTMGALGKYSPKEKLNVYSEMIKLTEKALRNGETVLVDATFYQQKMRDSFAKLATELATPVAVIEVWANEKLARQRVSKHREDSEAGVETYERIKAAFDEITQPHLRLESLDTNIDSMLSKSIEYINSVNETG